jgi:hypothetical protein
MTLRAFTAAEMKKAHALLASRVAIMQGRKLEEGDWASVYCGAKRIPNNGWSNLNIDICDRGLGVEHKMMCVRRRATIKEYCGTSMMHPSATRSIRTGSLSRSPNEAAVDILQQYADLIERRRQRVAETCKHGEQPDMRTGWLLWQLDLDEFLYFEEPMLSPDPKSYFAEWNERPARGARKATKNLWIYDRRTGSKRFSVTTEAGAKIQPYFDIPSPNDQNLHYFRVQGEPVGTERIRIWITPPTALFLKSALGAVDGDRVSAAIIASAGAPSARAGESTTPPALPSAEPLVITSAAYARLRILFKGVSDEHMMQQFAQHVFSTRK